MRIMIAILMIFRLMHTHAQSERCCLMTGDVLAPVGYGFMCKFVEGGISGYKDA